jgi:hypothetical protein
LDVWVEPTDRNAARVIDALHAFGAPLSGLSPADLVTPDVVFQIGLPPRRIDILTTLTGITFDEAWPDRVIHTIEGVRIPFIGRAAFIRNKRATGRARDLADLEGLGEGIDSSS